MRRRGFLAAISLLIALLVPRAGAPPAVSDPAAQGAAAFTRTFRPEHGLGPLFNATACVACHNEPKVGGMGQGSTGTVLRVGSLTANGFDPLDGHGGPLARARSVAEFGISCPLVPGIPPDANVTSVRNAPQLFGLGLIETIPDVAILAEAERQEAGGRVRGLPHRVADTAGQERIGRFGWKAQMARLEEFVGDALRTELGITNPLAPQDFVSPPDESSCGATGPGPEDDGRLVHALSAYIMTLEAPIGRAQHTQPSGAEIFRQMGCAECHTPSLPGPGGSVPLYSDLLLHDVGPALDDAVVQGQATGRHWRTTPLWGLRMRTRFLHDARAETLSVAITVHGGEAAAHAARFRTLTETEREALLAFLGDL
jgi:CxxC motif-containing protein (DUF1111 family)